MRIQILCRMGFCASFFPILLTCLCVVPTSYGKSDSVRICVSGNPLLKATHAVKYCDLLARSKKTHATCVFGTDRLDCLRLVSERKADFTVAEAEDLLFAKAVQLKSVLVVSEIREIKKEPFASKAVVVIRNDRNVLADLRGAKLCHPGWEQNAEKSAMFAQFLEERLAPQSCTSNITLQEDRLRATAAHFGQVCKAGPWIEDVEENARLKEAYPSLCALCDQPPYCGKSDKYWGKGGAATCLKDGAGDALWSTYKDVRVFFQLSQSPSSNANYSFLCMNGSTLPLTVQEPCFWMARPWQVVVANVKAAMDVQKTLEVLQEDKISSDWKENLLNVIESYLEYIVNLEATKTPNDYLEGIPGFLSAGEMTAGNCQPPHEIKWCTLPGSQFKKCIWMSKAATAFAIQPEITCVQRPGVEECIKAVADKETDLVVVPPDYIPAAKLQYKLDVIFFEGFKNRDSSYSISAYVKKDSDIHKLSDLQSQRACFTLHQGLGWRAALVGLRESRLASSTCNASGILHDFFGHLCVAAGSEEHDLPRCCGVAGEETDPDTAAFRCLATGGCDVAFVKTMSLPRRTDGNATSNGWYAEDFRTICRDTEGGECGWAWSPESALMTSASPQEVVYRETSHVLSQLSEQFVRRSKKNNMMLSMFGPFQDEPDVIFQDTSTGFISYSTFMDKWNGISSVEDILDRTKYCSRSTSVASNIFLTLTAVSFFVISQ